ncbi:MAG: glutathione S-transferase family protein [Pseudomonadota bacterium]
MSNDYVLYGASHSYYTGKARAYLRFKQLSFTEVAPTADVRNEIIAPAAGAVIIPVLQTPDGKLIQDTTEIIDFLESKHPDASVYPSSPRQKLCALLLELYGDEWLLMPAMHYRWSCIDEQREFIYSEFGRLELPEADLGDQIKAGEESSKIFSGLLPVLGITESTSSAIEAEYLQFLLCLDRHLADYDYLFGSRPSIGDFGLMGPLYAHLGRDPVPKKLMKEQAPNVYDWVERMNRRDRSPGEFLPGDDIPETLMPVLKSLCTDHLPEVVDVVKHNARYLEEHSGQAIPRVLGMHEFTIGSVTSERFVHSFAQWMYQRPYSYYHALFDAEKESADRMLEEIGGYDALNVPIEKWVTRKPGQLELVEGSAPESLT